ncbi:Gfo/Idh/MocA family protein [Streptomyces sp. NPDC059578]|uniref:Gfo/Idh/MocA family protein n=1 Tax=unclassified Streptomyces TaxID=2593676 RepID=UPI003653856A
MGRSVGVAVLGTGRMGADHVRRIDRVTPGARVVAVADPDAERARSATAGIDDVVVHTDPLAALDAPGVDAVLVASPDEAHEEAVLAAFARGLPVLCEKPLAAGAEAARRVVEAEERLGRRLLRLGFMRRSDSEYLRLREVLRSGRLGRPLMVHCVHRNVSSPPGFTSPMLVSSSVAHEIDAVRWLLGEEIVAVTALRPRRSGFAPDGLADPQFVLFETEGGVLVDVEVFVNSGFGYQVRCEAVCERGAVRIGAEPGPVVESAAGAVREVPQDFLPRFADAYDREVRAWVADVRAGRTTGASAWDGYAAALVAEAGVRAGRTGSRVTLTPPERPALYAAGR